MIQVNGKTVTGIYVGGALATGLYLGSQKLWPPDVVIPPAGSDPDFAKVFALTHADGVNGGTAVDVITGRSWYGSNGGSSAMLTTAQKKFGTAGIAASSAALYGFSYDAPINVGAQDFTIEFFISVSSDFSSGGDQLPVFSLGTFDDLISSVNCPIVGLGTQAGVGNVVSLFGSTGSTYIASGTPLTTAWTHIAFVRDSAGVRVYVGGSNAGQLVLAQVPTLAAASGLLAATDIGWSGNTTITGLYYMDEIRVTIGKARYTANFTPPDAPFPDHA